MAFFGSHYLSFFFLFALLLSPQIHAREGKFFSFFTHFRTTYNPNEPQVVLRKAKANPPALTPAPVPAPAPESILAPVLAPAPESEPDFVDRGDGYGLYGSGSSYVSPNKETPSSTSFENNNELLSGEINGDKKSFRTGYPQTRLNSNNNNNYVNNNEEYRSNYHGNGYSNNYNKDRYYDSYNGNGYEREREGMSDTRFVENGKYYYDVKNENENEKNYKVDGYELGRGSNENEGYYEKNKYPNEFDTMEEYEKKQQESQGYIP